MRFPGLVLKENMFYCVPRLCYCSYFAPGNRDKTLCLATSLTTSRSPALPWCCLQTALYPDCAMQLELAPNVNEPSARISRQLSGMGCLSSCRPSSFLHSLGVSKILPPDTHRPSSSSMSTIPLPTPRSCRWPTPSFWQRPGPAGTHLCHVKHFLLCWCVIRAYEEL